MKLLILCSFFIPLEQGLKLHSFSELILNNRSFFIPLEQGLKQRRGELVRPHIRSFFIPLEQGLKQNIATANAALTKVLSSFH